MSLVPELKGPTIGFIACLESRRVGICWIPANELSDVNFSSFIISTILQILLAVNFLLLCIVQVNCLIFGRQDDRLLLKHL